MNLWRYYWTLEGRMCHSLNKLGDVSYGQPLNEKDRCPQRDVQGPHPSAEKDWYHMGKGSFINDVTHLRMAIWMVCFDKLVQRIGIWKYDWRHSKIEWWSGHLNSSNCLNVRFRVLIALNQDIWKFLLKNEEGPVLLSLHLQCVSPIQAS